MDEEKKEELEVYSKNVCEVFLNWAENNIEAVRELIDEIVNLGNPPEFESGDSEMSNIVLNAVEEFFEPEGRFDNLRNKLCPIENEEPEEE